MFLKVSTIVGQFVLISLGFAGVAMIAYLLCSLIKKIGGNSIAKAPPTEYPLEWGEFCDTGLLVMVNQLLHYFGWSIVISEDGKSAVPARVNYRGYSDFILDESYLNVSDYLDNMSETLKDEVFNQVNDD